MSALPEKWEMRPISELGKVLTGNTPPTSDLSNYGDYLPFIKPTQLVDAPVSSGEQSLSQKGCEKSRVVPKGGVLVSCIGNLGKTAIAKREVSFNQQINAVIFDEVIPEYGFYYFQTLKFRKQLNDLSSATTISIVNKSKFESISIPIAPLEQQKQIVAKIEELFSHIDAGIDALKQSKKLLKQYRQSVLKAAVTGELSKEWREQNKEKLEPASKLLERILHERRQKWEAQQLEQFKAKGKVPKDEGWKGKYEEPQQLDIKCEISETWIQTPLEAITDPTRPITYGILKPGEYVEGGIPMLRILDIKNGVVNITNVHRVSQELSDQYKRTKLNGDEILISLVGTIGLTARVPSTLSGVNVHRNLGVISLSDGVISEYVDLYLKSPSAKTEISDVTTGANQPLLNLEQVKKIKINIPSIVEQRIICSEVEKIISSIDVMEKSIDSELQRSERLKHSVLQSAFAGNLSRV